MPKFIVSQIERYEIEAETMEDAQLFWREQLLTGISSDYVEYLDGSTTYEEVEN